MTRVSPTIEESQAETVDEQTNAESEILSNLEGARAGAITLLCIGLIFAFAVPKVDNIPIAARYVLSALGGIAAVVGFILAYKRHQEIRRFGPVSIEARAEALDRLSRQDHSKYRKPKGTTAREAREIDRKTWGFKRRLTLPWMYNPNGTVVTPMNTIEVEPSSTLSEESPSFDDIDLDEDV